jgi:aminoglycoside 6'-N-acetyltransferase
MIKGLRIILRPIEENDWPIIEEWGRNREALWGPFQRFQMDNVPMLRMVYQQTGLLKRDSGFLLIETSEDHQVIGFVRYTLIPFPDGDLPHPEIGFGIPVASVHGKGYAREAVKLLVDYLFSGYPSERISAFTDDENIPAQKVMEGVGFRREGTLRRAMFRDGQWHDMAIFGVIRQDWKSD